MKLQKFKEKNHKKNLIIIIGIIVTLLLGFIYLYYSFAIFTDDKEFHVINGTVPDQKYDVMFSYYVNNKSVASIPTSKNYDVTISCNNGVTGSWDYSEWGPNLTNFSKSKTVCSVYYVTPTNIAAQITDKTKNYTYVNSLDKKRTCVMLALIPIIIYISIVVIIIIKLAIHVNYGELSVFLRV